MGSAIAQPQVRQCLKQHKQAFVGVKTQQRQGFLLNAFQPWHGGIGLCPLIKQTAQNVLQVQPAAFHCPALQVVNVQNFRGHGRAGHGGHVHTTLAQGAHVAVQRPVPGLRIGFGHAGLVRCQHLAVRLRLQQLATAQQQATVRGANVYWQCFAKLQSAKGNRYARHHKSAT